MLSESAIIVPGETGVLLRRGSKTIPTATPLPVCTTEHITFAFLFSNPAGWLFFFEVPHCGTEIGSQTAEARGMTYK